MKSRFKNMLSNFRHLPMVGVYRPRGDETDETILPQMDIRGGSLIALAETHKDKALTFLENVPRAFGWLSTLTMPAVLPLMDKLSRNWLEKTNNPYLAEIEETAKIVGKPGIFTMGVSYEWGCTSGAFNTQPKGVTLARVMDWPFPMMGNTMVVAHQNGAAGDFHSVTWPGYNGVVQAMAPGRFSATINQAPQPFREGQGGLRSWIEARLAIYRRRDVLPPPHALRKAFETAVTYDQAKKYLMEARLSAPAIFILAGTKKGEGCVIERTPDAGFVREMHYGRVTVANMFESKLKDSPDNWFCGRGDSLTRSAYLRAVSSKKIATQGDFPWFYEAPEECALRSHFSRVVFTANAATNTLQVMGTAGERPVTKVFRLSGT